MLRRAAMLLLGLTWLAPGCAAAVPAGIAPGHRPAGRACPAGTHPMRVVELFFGRMIGGTHPGKVDAAAWARFADHTLVRAFPAGFTVRDARGAWRDPATGHTGQEATKDVLVALADQAGALRPVRHVIAVYRHRFRQHAVGLLVTAQCGSF